MRMSTAERLKFLADKCEQLASVAPNENIRERHLDLAASYRRLAEREHFLESQPLQSHKVKEADASQASGNR